MPEGVRPQSGIEVLATPTLEEPPVPAARPSRSIAPGASSCRGRRSYGGVKTFGAGRGNESALLVALGVLPRHVPPRSGTGRDGHVSIPASPSRYSPGTHSTGTAEADDSCEGTHLVPGRARRGPPVTRGAAFRVRESDPPSLLQRPCHGRRREIGVVSGLRHGCPRGIQLRSRERSRALRRRRGRRTAGPSGAS